MVVKIPSGCNSDLLVGVCVGRRDIHWQSYKGLAEEDCLGRFGSR